LEEGRDALRAHAEIAGREDDEEGGDEAKIIGEEQAEGIGQINAGLSQVDQVTQQVTAGAEESASASEELSNQSLQLKQMLGKFRLRQQDFNLNFGLPDEITPEMIQLLKSMLKQSLPEPCGRNR